MESVMPTLRILGTRGIPARHGGFETFAEYFSNYLIHQGWNVEVYCQELGKGPIRTEMWNGIKRIIVPTVKDSPLHTIIFDFKSVLHAMKGKATCLTLGYNTAIFTLLLRLSGQKTVMNMDGIEWSRAKWAFPARVWLYLNEWIGARLNHVLIADHPEIARHLQRHTRSSKIRIIPYGADAPEESSPILLKQYNLHPKQYGLLIARPEPENSILEIVKAWSAGRRGYPLVVLGNYIDSVAYHREVRSAASDEVIFLGAIYQKDLVYSLRMHALIYLHGHQAGGTNPSLVEAMACSNPVIAHENPFNQWVAGTGAKYFRDAENCTQLLDEVLSHTALLHQMADASKARQEELFTFEKVHQAYQQVIEETLLIDNSPVLPHVNIPLQKPSSNSHPPIPSHLEPKTIHAIGQRSRN
jgi:glycosyltransferase involved in cell wall biosynthesis